MEIEKKLLSKQEKSRLRRVMTARILTLLLMVIPAIIVFPFYILYLAIMSFVNGNSDFFSYLVVLGFAPFYMLVNKYIFPYYRNILKYKNVRAKHIIKTTVLSLSHRTHSAKISFCVKTDWGVIDTAVDVILFPDLPFLEMEKGMTIYIHLLPGMENEFLRISKHVDK